MKVSAGTIITDGKSVLGCVPFGQAKKAAKNLDIPKGNIDEGEIPIQAAIRECKEEAGISLRAADMEMIGKFDYKPEKQLFIFVARIPIPPLNTLKCTSFLPHIRAPEIVSYRIVPYQDIEEMFFRDLGPIIIKALGLGR
jgi:8-oxo-dGTP pyrophosphatase MutT (NUDIX family)